jgi:hypothetical protein
MGSPVEAGTAKQCTHTAQPTTAVAWAISACSLPSSPPSLLPLERLRPPPCRTTNNDDRASSFAPLPRLTTTTPTFSGQNTTQPSTPSPFSPIWLYTNTWTRPPRQRHLPEYPPSDHDHRRPPTSTATVPFAPGEPLVCPRTTIPMPTSPR